jgi:hypothetical protein
MRAEQGCFHSKEDVHGSRYFLHRVRGDPRPQDMPPQRPGPEANLADADTLDTVYSALLSQLTLSENHREALQRRRLADEAIALGGYRTLQLRGRPRIVRELYERFGDRLLRVPGFVVKDGESGCYRTLRGPAGLLVPCRDRTGRVIALKVRCDSIGQGGPRYVYVSSAGYGGPGSGAPVHCPVGTPDAAELVRLTEGELKADVVKVLTGEPTISIPGVTNWKPALTVLQALGCKTVRLALDADAPEKPGVGRCLSACADELVANGLSIELERWNIADGKGLDDLLTNGKQPDLLKGDSALSAIREIVASATADEEPAETDLHARVNDVLDAGGAEALFRNEQLLRALANLLTSNWRAYAAIRASIRHRISLRDLDKAVRAYQRPPASTGSEESPYIVQDGRICHMHQTTDGPVSAALCNFSAHIVEDRDHDDGAEKTRVLAVEGNLDDGTPLPRVEITAESFPRMEWVVPAWGSRAVIYAGMGKREHLRAALQLLSGKVQRRTVYAHTGWRKIGDSWFYLHAGGAIGRDGLVADVPVLLPEPLQRFDLPAPPQGEALVDAVRASLGLLRLGPHRVTFPLLAAPYRSVLGDCDFSEFLDGPSGSFKTEAAALVQQHFGATMDARHLPGNWASTSNSLEGLAFAAKDAVLVVDDFSPSGSSADVQRSHRDADRLLRGQGNGAGRQRMRADATLRPPKPPRGLVLCTGEDIPRGQSLCARVFFQNVSPGDLGPQPPAPNPTLTACQRDANAGKYAQALAGFLRWLAPQYGAVRARIQAEAAELRDRALADGQHARTPAIVGSLAVGFRYLLEFARSIGAVSASEREELWERGWRAFREAAAASGSNSAIAEPAGLFLRLTSAAVSSGRAHLANADGDPPPEAKRWGWRRQGSDWEPQGRRIGWVNDDGVYLEPEAAYAEACGLAHQQGESFPVAARTLRRRLNDKGLLITTEQGRGKLTVRRTLEGTRREVLHVAWPSTSGPDSCSGQENGPVPGAENGRVNGTPAHSSASPGSNWQRPATAEPDLGRSGRSDTGADAGGGETINEYRCPHCSRSLDARRRCGKCFDRLCVDCGRPTGSYFILRCVACGIMLEENLSNLE